jgi:hypothetical protein
LWPESSGVVANRFFDPTVNRTFSYTNATEANDIRWWKGEPFWTTVQKAGMKSASFFWPGSEVEGLKPDYVLTYDGSVNNSDRVKKVVEWLDLDWTLRPSFITLYMSDVDSAGHQFGPTSTQTAAAVKAVDDALGQLLLAIDNEGRQNRLLIDLLIVSDHGMTSINPNRTILLDRLINMSDVYIPDLGGPVASIWPIDPNKTESIVQSLQIEYVQKREEESVANSLISVCSVQNWNAGDEEEGYSARLSFAGKCKCGTYRGYENRNLGRVINFLIFGARFLLQLSPIWVG